MSEWEGACDDDPRHLPHLLPRRPWWLGPAAWVLPNDIPIRVSQCHRVPALRLTGTLASLWRFSPPSLRNHHLLSPLPSQATIVVGVMRDTTTTAASTSTGAGPGTSASGVSPGTISWIWGRW